MFIQIKSNNPEFSWVLNKNPNTIPTIKEQREGKAFAWFLNDNTYSSHYYENTVKVNPYASDDNNKTNYINSRKFESCECALGLLGNFLNTLYNKEEEQDKEGFDNQVIVATPRIRENLINSFEKYFKDYEISFDKYLIVKSKKKIREIISLVTVLLMLESIKQKEMFISANDIIKKYLNCINTIQAPYIIRYIFKVNVLGSKKKFELNKESVNTDNIKMELGSNYQQRYSLVEKSLSYKNSILDFGCGEGGYMKLSRKLKDENTSYYCFDKDKTLYEQIEKKIKRKRYENIKCLEELSIEEPVDIILSEVIEHNEKEDIQKIFESFKGLNINSIIITTPNKDFNEIYELGDELRHEDHKIEFILGEFEKIVGDNLAKIGLHSFEYEVESGFLGDLVNEKQPQLYLIVKKKEKDEK